MPQAEITADLLLKHGVTHYTDEDLHDLYDQMLDEIYESPSYLPCVDPSRLIKEYDPVAYRCGFNDWLDSEAYVEIEGEYFAADEYNAFDAPWLCDECEDECDEIEFDGLCEHCHIPEDEDE